MFSVLTLNADLTIALAVTQHEVDRLELRSERNLSALLFYLRGRLQRGNALLPLPCRAITPRVLIPSREKKASVNLLLYTKPKCVHPPRPVRATVLFVEDDIIVFAHIFLYNDVYCACQRC
jgi:hypothetical protein